MPHRKDTPNPYPIHTINHFFWNVYHLLAYQFARYAIAAWAILVVAVAVSFYRQQETINQNRILIHENEAVIHEGRRSIREADYRICIRASTAFSDIIKASDASLGKPGSPGFAYYKTHPGELEAAHKANAKYLKRFDGSKCKDLPTARKPFR
jgi:hypothetical protein